MDCNDTDFEELVAESSGILGIELAGRFGGTSGDEEAPGVPVKEDEELRGEGLGFVSESITALGVVEIGI